VARTIGVAIAAAGSGALVAVIARLGAARAGAIFTGRAAAGVAVRAFARLSAVAPATAGAAIARATAFDLLFVVCAGTCRRR
jgi:hypothetical protein